MNNHMIEKLNRLKAMQKELVETSFGNAYQGNPKLVAKLLAAIK